MDTDPETIERLKSLGYVGGTVIEDFTFDQTKDDPKDLLGYHSLANEINWYLVSKEYDKVQVRAEKMVEQRPECALGYEKLGAVTLKQKDYSRARHPAHNGTYVRLEGTAHNAGYGRLS